MADESKLKKKELPSQSVLRELLDYDPASGLLTWRPRAEHLFRLRRQYTKFNKEFAGQPALYNRAESGHLRGRVLGQQVFAHRIIWKWVTGLEPTEIDHINGNSSDNRFENLRVVTRAENAKNHKRREDNTSGVVGVYWDKKCQKWTAKIGVRGRLVNLGFFECKDRAIAVRKQSEREHGFHENHGREQCPM